MSFPTIPVGVGIEVIVEWLTTNFAPLFRGISISVKFFLLQITHGLMATPWPIILIVMGALALWIKNWKISIFAMGALFLLGSMQLWEAAISTLALATTAVTISLVIGVPLGIIAARSDLFHSLIRPILDFMQTMPAFVYLVPAIMFFGIGRVPAVMATVIFASPPTIRLTNLGIRQVSKEVREAGEACGSTKWQLLIKILLPLSLPSIMAGINQSIMLSLSMSVLAAMIAAGGLGEQVLMGLSQINIGRAFEAGLGIVLMAMILDRLTRKKEPYSQ
ncbi:MAG: proline/glycine betaine ABC transporter permease [Halanaerobiales bacterium]|nr:proline/glycine betaine ABC transporter permease [Halanaerobiales bacterium]